MAYEYITKYTSGNKTRGRGGNKISGIVIHWWDEAWKKPKFYPVINWLCRPGGSSSAHYVVEAGRVACIVDVKDTAWHCGHYPSNQRTIGIECNPRMSQGDLETVAELIADLRKTYGNLPLSKHSDYQQTKCPGTYASKIAWLDQRANELLGKPKPKPKPKPTRKPLKVDGWCGRATVGDWQRANKTPVDYVISSQPSDLRGIHAGINPNAIQYVPRNKARGSQLIMSVQRSLKKRGLYKGEINGFFDRPTITALQKRYGTPADGVVSPQSRMIMALQRALNKQLGA